MNGYRVKEIGTYTEKEIVDINDSIKSIVTKEQFNQMKYIVGDESNAKN